MTPQRKLAEHLALLFIGINPHYWLLHPSQGVGITDRLEAEINAFVEKESEPQPTTELAPPISEPETTSESVTQKWQPTEPVTEAANTAAPSEEEATTEQPSA